MLHRARLCNHHILFFRPRWQQKIWRDLTPLLPVAHLPRTHITSRRKRLTASPRVRRRERLRGSLFLHMILPFLRPLLHLLLPPQLLPRLHQLPLSARRFPRLVMGIMRRRHSVRLREVKALVNFCTRAAWALKESQCIISSRICHNPGELKDLHSLFLTLPRGRDGFLLELNRLPTQWLRNLRFVYFGHPCMSS